MDIYLCHKVLDFVIIFIFLVNNRLLKIVHSDQVKTKNFPHLLTTIEQLVCNTCKDYNSKQLPR